MSNVKRVLERFGELKDIFDNVDADSDSIIDVLVGTSLSPDGVLNTELSQIEAWCLAIIDAMNENENEYTSYSCPVLRRVVPEYKKNMISNKRQGRKEVKDYGIGRKEEKSKSESVREFFFGQKGGT